MRILGLEIRAIGNEVASEGKERARSLVTRPKRAWWHPFSNSGRLVWSGACVVLLVMVAVPSIQRSLRSRGVESAAVGGVAMERAKAADSCYAPTAKAPMRSEGRAEGEAEQSSGIKNDADPATSKFGTTSRPQEEKAGEAQDQKSSPGSNYADSTAAHRMVVRNGDISLRVESVSDAERKVREMATAMGGFVVNSNNVTDPNRTPSAFLTIRVKATFFDQAMARLEALGTKIGGSTSGEDVTAQYADTTARIKVLKAEEESYITMLRGARRTGEILEIKERLSSVRQELESLEATKHALKDLSTLSTINVSLEQKPKAGDPDKPKEGFEDTWATAVNGLVSVFRWLGNAVIFAFVYSPIWLPPVLLFWWLGKKAKKSS